MSIFRDLTQELYKRELTGKKITAGILLVIGLLTLLDISVDFMQGVALTHILIEASTIPLAAFGLYFIWQGFERSREENRLLKLDLEQVSTRAADWKKEAFRYVNGLSIVIDAQLSRWGLSASEKEIALLLLKGLSHKEIAEVRNTAERTARQQALAVYEKSGLDGRAQLAAFFLEDLLAPMSKQMANMSLDEEPVPNTRF